MNHITAQRRLKHLNIGMACTIVAFSALDYPTFGYFALLMMASVAIAVLTSEIEEDFF